MNAAVRVWIVGTVLMVTGIGLIVAGALASVAEVVVALPAAGTGLLAAGLAALLVKLPWEAPVKRGSGE